MSKITVKHFLNKDLKPQINNGSIEYPVYVQVIYNRNNYKFKSENIWFEYLSDDKINAELMQSILKSERLNIIRTIELLEKYNINEISSKNIYKYSQKITKVIDKNYSKFYENEFSNFPELLMGATYENINNLCLFLNIPNINFQKDYDDRIEAIDMLCSNISKDWSNFKELEKLEEYLLIDYFYGEKKQYFINIIQSSFGIIHTDEEKERTEIEKYYNYFKDFLLL